MEILIFLMIVHVGLSGRFPNYLKPCKNDENLNKCAVENGNHAVPSLSKGSKQLHTPVFSPFFIPSLTFDPTSTLHVALSNLTLHNLETLKLVDAKMEPDKQQAEFSATIPNVKMEGLYSINGQLMIFPIHGDGSLNMTIDELSVNYQTKWNFFERKGVKYANLEDSSVSIDFAKGKCYLSDLFADNEQMNKVVNNLFQNNLKDIFQELRPGIEKVINVLISSVASRVFKSIPYSQLFL